MTNTPAPIHLESEAATMRLAQACAHQMAAGDVMILSGGLAAGKTFFVRAAVAALGSTDPVTSPTYTLAHIYNRPEGPVVHIDAYRIENVANFADLALEDEMESGVSFIEWGELLKGEFEDYIQLDLSPSPDDETTRFATFSAKGTHGQALLTAILKEFAA